MKRSKTGIDMSQYGLDTSDELCKMLSEELSKSIDKSIMDKLFSRNIKRIRSIEKIFKKK